MTIDLTDMTEYVQNPETGLFEEHPMTRERYLQLRPDLRLRVTSSTGLTVPADGATLAIAQLQLVNALDEPVQQAMSFTGVLNDGEDTRQLQLNAQGRANLPFVVALKVGTHKITSPQFPGTLIYVTATEPNPTPTPESLRPLLTVTNRYIIGIRELRHRLGEVPDEALKNMSRVDLEATIRYLIKQVKQLEQRVTALEQA